MRDDSHIGGGSVVSLICSNPVLPMPVTIPSTCEVRIIFHFEKIETQTI